MVALLGYAGLPRVFADSGEGEKTLSEDMFWPTIVAVQEHLWPARDGTPDLLEFNATSYLAAALLDPQVEAGEREYISNGVAPLEGFTQSQFERSFFELDALERDAVLRKIETSPAGQYWLSLIIYYLFEALLADPVYGGNTDSIGWHWLQHKPGFPRPPAAYPYSERGRA
jgi:gluconate 2-dehydrogenase gamma chain